MPGQLTLEIIWTLSFHSNGVNAVTLARVRTTGTIKESTRPRADVSSVTGTEPGVGVANGSQSHERPDAASPWTELGVGGASVAGGAMSGHPWVSEVVVGEVGATRPVAVEPVGECSTDRWVRVGSLMRRCLVR